MPSNYGRCRSCDCRYPITDLRRIHERYCCERCYTRYIHKCTECGEERFQGDMICISRSVHIGESKWICHNCGQGKYTQCRRCGAYILKDKAFKTEGGELYCLRCYLVPSGYINDYSYRPQTFCFLSTDRDKKELLYFGIELEIEAKGGVSSQDILHTIQSLPSFVYPVHDGSVEYGFEIVGQPATYNWLLDNKKRWENMLALREKGWRSFETETCGMHIHLSKNAFRNFHLYKFIKFFYSHPKFILQISQRERKALTRWASTQKGSDKKIIYKAKEKGGRNKYTAVNLQNRYTIEIRIFRGTLNPKSFWKNIEFTKAIFDFTNDTSAEKLGIRDFKKWIIGRRKLFPNLCSFLTDRDFIALSGVEKEYACASQSTNPQERK